MILLAGDSHTTVLKRAHDELHPSDPLVSNIKIGPLGPGYKLSRRFFKPHKNRITFNLPMARNTFLKTTGKQALWFDQNILYGFSLRMHSFKISQNPTWLRHAPYELAAEKGKAPISKAAMLEIIKEDIGSTFEFYELLLKNNVPFFTIEGPPLNENIQVLKRGADKEIILAVDKAHRHYMQSWLCDKGIDIVKAPPAAFTEEGFLKPEYYADREGDVRHANTPYGRLMLQNVLDYLQSHHKSRLQA
ncbi:hypothetical protein GCM10017044_17810 [Kordiimonas sediminis]|uniref:Uncharacterized protein n=1 Tax=Kordiimonas sediminis TaxID=1735581 RepID=A0A919ASX8_9PROT|nr:hypothetical protein [Kordiimonas sediminis]GHF23677.1 hypothetical protein GCM10017044_17810 [Kordiimonas sediminis]